MAREGEGEGAVGGCARLVEVVDGVVMADTFGVLGGCRSARYLLRHFARSFAFSTDVLRDGEVAGVVGCARLLVVVDGVVVVNVLIIVLDVVVGFREQAVLLLLVSVGDSCCIEG